MQVTVLVNTAVFHEVLYASGALSGLPFSALSEVYDSLCQLAQHTRTADACHILQTDFGCSRLNELVGNVCIVLYLSLIHI